jgi:hypothetical protein
LALIPARPRLGLSSATSLWKLGSSLADCRVNIHTPKTKVTYSGNHSYLESLHNLDNCLVSINDKILELGAYQKSGMAARLSFMSVGIHRGAVMDIADLLTVNLQVLIRYVDSSSSGGTKGSG